MGEFDVKNRSDALRLDHELEQRPGVEHHRCAVGRFLDLNGIDELFVHCSTYPPCLKIAVV